LAEIAGTRPPAGYERSRAQHDDFAAVFLGASTPEQGRRVLWSILEWTRLYRTSFVHGDRDATFVNEGARNIGIRLLTTLHEAPREGLTPGRD
jgi:hypothetical protein